MTTSEKTSTRITALQASLDELAARAEQVLNKLETTSKATLAQVEAEALTVIGRLASGTIPPPENPATVTGRRDMRRARRETIPAPYSVTTPAGDRVSAKELRGAVEAMLVQRPHTFREIADATNARQARIYGILATLKAEGKPLVHLGNPRNGSWYLAPKGKEKG